MSPYRLKTASSDPSTYDDLDLLRRTLAAIEEIAAQGESPEELHRLLKIIHCGSTRVTPSFEPGADIFRAIRIDAKPLQKSRLSYPPKSYVLQNGRLNGIGEILFYGSVGQWQNVLYECHAKVGDTFALGCWRTTNKILLNHMGYSGPLFQSRSVGRKLDTWMNSSPVGSRDEVLQAWQSDVFTKEVADGEEHRYNLSIALARLALEEFKNAESTVDFPGELAGVLYPSVAAKFYGNNVALKPSIVDSSLELNRVVFIKVLDIPQLAYTSEEKVACMRFDILDVSMEHRGDGRLIWNGESTALSVTPCFT